MPRSGPEGPATGTDLPVARVAVEVGLPHLDRPFDYLVPPELAESAAPGCRVRVRFAGRLVTGFVLARLPTSESGRALHPLQRVVSPLPVLDPDVARLCRQVADRWAGSMADVLRLAVPPRHARAESRFLKTGVASANPGRSAPGGPDPLGPAAHTRWGRYESGTTFLSTLRTGGIPRAAWTVLPGEDWAGGLSEAIRATVASGRGALLVVPDHRDLAAVDRALTRDLGEGMHVSLSADLGPAERYARFLRVRLDQVRVVVGTRAAAYAPVQDLGLVAVWDDGDDLLAEPRAPYAHARDVVLLRAHLTGSAVLLASSSRSVEVQRLVGTGWLHPVEAGREQVRRMAPRVHTVGSDTERARDPAAASARLPSLAWRVARSGLERGPVLVQVARRGYHTALACQACRQRARCATCSGPLEVATAGGVPCCSWCGCAAPHWRCPACQATALRTVRFGHQRTAEELGRAFPGVAVRSSGMGNVLAEVDETPALVIATPGAEPRCAAGYAAALLLDGDLQLALPSIRSGEEALRRWFGAASLVRSPESGGEVVLVAEPASPPVQAAVRWDPVGFAERELADRVAARLPPAVRVAEISGSAEAVEEVLAAVERQLDEDEAVPVLTGSLPPEIDPAGTERHRALLRVPLGQAGALAAAVRAVLAQRAATKRDGPADLVVRVRLDPVDLA